MIKLLRVDHRLIHGQVAFSWTGYLGVNCILVANDSAASNDLEMTTLRLARPSNTKLIVKSVKDSIDALSSGKADKYELFIVVRTVKDAYELAKNIPGIEDINLGNVKASENTHPYEGNKSINLSDEDEKMLRDLVDMGKKVEIRMVPTDGVKLFK